MPSLLKIVEAQQCPRKQSPVANQSLVLRQVAAKLKLEPFKLEVRRLVSSFLWAVYIGI
jgi:hypothetical protein